jgi:hypothetical protein
MIVLMMMIALLLVTHTQNVQVYVCMYIVYITYIYEF